MIGMLVRRASTVLLLTLCVLAFGSLSYATLPREAAPLACAATSRRICDIVHACRAAACARV